MNNSTRNNRRAATTAMFTALALALSLGVAAAQGQAPPAAPPAGPSGVIVPSPAAGPTPVAVQEPAPRPSEGYYVYGAAAPQAVWSVGGENPQVPQDIRIMQRIVSTALGEVDAPELPQVLQDSNADSPDSVLYSFGGNETRVVTVPRARGRVVGIGGRDVTGFYMQGYGYLFTVKWQVGRGGNGLFVSGVTMERLAELEMLQNEAQRAATSAQADEARAAGDAERALQDRREQLQQQQEAWDQWSAEYRGVLAQALREVVARYGSTLKRAAPEESITFIADFGGGEDETVTVTARRGQLTGASPDDNMSAVEMSKGGAGVSESLRTELKIMAEIIDGSLQGDTADNTWSYTTESARYFGGDSSYQYVPGYGVLFRKTARLNFATQVVAAIAESRSSGGVGVAPLRERIEQSTEEQREFYAQHLADLKDQTAAILATYGPTLTGLDDDAWVGIYYNVGSAAGLLEGGISNFLVQARMSDVRQAGSQADGAAWLLDRLVTNEKQEQ